MVVIVPVRRFEDGKTRLADVLSRDERTRLSRHCAERVLAATDMFTRCVVSDDPGVCSWAVEHGAIAVPVGATGLNAALLEALPGIVERHAPSFVAVCHADLPLADELGEIIGAATTDHRPLIITDRESDGTNVMVARTDLISAAGFHYGVGSASRHHDEFARLGVECRIHRHDTLSIDLDTPDDLFHPAVASFVDRLRSAP